VNQELRVRPDVQLFLLTATPNRDGFRCFLASPPARPKGPIPTPPAHREGVFFESGAFRGEGKSAEKKLFQSLYETLWRHILRR
jgi:hypothetical protein